MKILTIIALTAAVFAQGAPARATDCDRACLASLMERYLVALDAHDPELLPRDPTSIINFPNSMAKTEAFRIRDGKITHILAQMVMLPNRQPTGWAGR